MNPLMELVRQHNARFRPIREEAESPAAPEKVELVLRPAVKARDVTASPVGGSLYRFVDRMPPEKFKYCWVWSRDAQVWWRWPHVLSWAEDRANWPRLAAKYQYWTDYQGDDAPDWTPDV